MAAEMDLGDVEDEVLTWLSGQKADVLEVFQVISLPLGEQLKGKKRTLLKNLLDHLCTLEDVVDGDITEHQATHENEKVSFSIPFPNFVITFPIILSFIFKLLRCKVF